MAFRCGTAQGIALLSVLDLARLDTVVFTLDVDRSRRLLQPGESAHPPDSREPARQLCCTAAQLFMTLRCNCWLGLGFNLQTVNHMADQAARCVLPYGAAETDPYEHAATVRT
jgi:hypothetical protein